MDSLLALTSSSSLSLTSQSNSFQATYYRTDSLVVEATLSRADDDAASNQLDGIYRGLSNTARQILEKLNQILKQELPNGIENLRPEEVTPEATADRIVSSVTGYFELYRKHNPELSDEEALDKFMKAVNTGVNQGYEEAFNILEGLGAFEFEGVKAGVEKTRILIDAKLNEFYEAKKKELNIQSPNVEKETASTTKNNLLTQAGLLSVVA